VAGAWAIAIALLVPALVKTRERPYRTWSRNLRTVALEAIELLPPVCVVELPPADPFACEKKLLALAGAIALAGAVVVGVGACAE
jgi:hypothetical protein